MAEIVRINGALVEARPMAGAALYEVARVGGKGILGEVIRLHGDTGHILVYEDTIGLRVGEPVELTGRTLTVQLGPGLLGSILDGLARPLSRLAEAEGGDFIQPGQHAVTLDPMKRWEFVALVEPGATVAGGDFIGVVQERPTLQHKIMLPHDQSGVIGDIESRECSVEEPVGHLEDGTPIMLYQRWPVRVPRPSAERLHADRPLITAQRLVDFLFPLAEGGSMATPGGFGTGKTVLQQSLARHATTDVVVFVGCGERGNEMADVLHEFPELIDPVTGDSIMDRTILAVNTSNMPMAAREASVYLGMTLGEYYRDMGYRVAVMCDSLSRWAEALREIGSRLQEMPGEEGYPTYLGNRLGKLYERAGRVVAKGDPERVGAVSLIGSFSPPGGDFSEPVTQAAMRVTGGLWALDAGLAHQRQFPAINWEASYSLYTEATAAWFVEHVAADWPELRAATLELLQRETEVLEIAGLVGPEALQDPDRLILDAARVVHEMVLGQNAYDPNDAASSPTKTYQLARLAHALNKAALKALEVGTAYKDLDLKPATTAMASARSTGDTAMVTVGRELLGRAFTGVGVAIDGYPNPIGEEIRPIWGAPINPYSRAKPIDYIETGISAIDGMNTLVRGQKLPVFSGPGLPGLELAAQIVENARAPEGEAFAVIFCAMGITARETHSFLERFERSGALERIILYINEARDPTIERLLAPRFALAEAEYLAFGLGYEVLVVLADMTHYCEALREIGTAREEIPGRRGYPGYMYTDLANIYERVGILKGPSGSVTQIPILTMPDDDITHPIPDLTGYITEGQVVLSRDLHRRGIFPPIDVLPSLSRLMNAGIGAGKTTVDHREVANQLYAVYARGREARLMTAIVGEAGLSESDRRALAFGERFEREFVGQGGRRRTIKDTLEVGWQLLETMRRDDLLRISDATWAARQAGRARGVT